MKKKLRKDSYLKKKETAVEEKNRRNNKELFVNDVDQKYGIFQTRLASLSNSCRLHNYSAHFNSGRHFKAIPQYNLLNSEYLQETNDRRSISHFFLIHVHPRSQHSTSSEK